MMPHIKSLICGIVAAALMAAFAVALLFLVALNPSGGGDDILRFLVVVPICPVLLVALVICKPAGFFRGLLCAVAFAIPVFLSAVTISLLVAGIDFEDRRTHDLGFVCAVTLALALWLLGSRGFIRGGTPTNRSDCDAEA
jgi:hypothetical protein